MSDSSFLKQFEELVPVPMFTTDSEGKVTSANSLIGEVFLYDGIVGSDIVALTGIKYDTLKDAAKNNTPVHLERNERIFNMVPTIVESNNKEHMYIYFVDITDLEELRERYEEERTCLAIVNIDNFDEIGASMTPENQLAMISKIDTAIRKWALTLEASITRYKENTYFLIFSFAKCKQEIEAKFPILDEIRSIESEADFPFTLSIGVGIKGKTPEVNDELALQALDLALGRGGDQAVVKEGDNISYFGGKAQTVEKNNKGKSRIIGHALKRLIQASSKVFIMGHKNPDMDSFGSAMGISRLSLPFNRDTYIVLENFGEALDLLYEEAKESENYNIITRQKAIKLIDENSLVIVVDTHKPSIIECPELLEVETKRVVLDHHRKGEEFIDNATLVYMEPYASSTSELVTEILQYTVDRKDVTKLEAEGLLAGIFVDTNHFSVKSGVRTFEAAAWLRRAGADLSKVKGLFQVGKDLFMSRIKGVSNAVFLDDGLVYSICEEADQNAQMICSLVADELLTIRGMKVAFAIGVNHKGKTIISARSIGERNVQVIMEKFDGGGHINAAGAQTELSPEEVIEKLKSIMEENQ